VIPALKDIHPPVGLEDKLAKTSKITQEDLQAARSGTAPSDVPT
jgi:hypothetical protein